jgi:hypothetical protein
MSSHIKRAVSAAFLPALFLAGCGGGDSGSATPAPATPGVTTRASLPPAPALPAAVVPAGANTFECRNVRIGAVEIDSVNVPAGAICVLDGTGLAGNLTANRDAVADARNVRIRGSVQADGAASVTLAGTSAVTGAVQIKQGGAANVLNAQIGGDLQLTQNRGALLAQDNRVTGNIQVEQNTGGVALIANLANGNLQCKENQPAPTGADNRAAQLEGQCAALAPAAPPAPAPVPPGTTPPTLPPAPTPIGSGTFVCSNVAIGAVSIDTVSVPAGARCVLDGTQLIGSILVEAGGEVAARNIRVNGNLVGDRAARIVLDGSSRVGGSVQVKEGGPVTVAGADITGDIQVTKNAGLAWLQNNRVGGNVQVMENLGGALLYTNRIVGNLQCKQNQPAPDGSGNTAAQKEDQCVGL